MREILDVINRFADRPFIIDSVNDCSYTYAEFHALTLSLSSKLSASGVGRGDHIGILLNNCIEFATLYFACLNLGAVAVPINPQLHVKEIDFIICHAGLKMLIYSPLTATLVSLGTLSNLNLIRFCITSERSNDLTWSHRNAKDITSSFKPFQGVLLSDTFTITFTSGTTGSPKGVMHRISNLVGSAVEFNRELGFTPEDRFYHVFSMAYMAGFLNTLICPFVAGASVVIGPAFDPMLALKFWDMPLKYNVNTLWLVPTILSSLLKLDRNSAGKDYCREYIRNVCIGTAPLPLKVQREFEETYGVRTLESYGLSETLFVATNSLKTDAVPGSVGTVLPSVQLEFDEQEDTSLGPSREILISCPFSMIGYLNFETLKPDPLPADKQFSSGDLGYLDAKGNLFISGRKKDLIIKGGVNVSPSAVEYVLLEHPAVENAAVIGLPHDFYGEEVTAVLKLKPTFDLPSIKSELESLCRSQLNSMSLPSKYIEFTDFPVNNTGKIQKAKLKEMIIREVAGIAVK